jgi:hypothetical protein
MLWLDDVMCPAISPAAIAPAEKQIAALLRERHHLHSDEEDDFNLRHPAEIARAGAESQRIMTILLASIASVSFIVGGIGIMNIMLVSVTERTREIGVRLAVGAKGSDVRRQFLGEATVLSLLGGSVESSLAKSHHGSWHRPCPGLADSRAGRGACDRCGVFGARGSVLRLLPGAQSREPRSDRRAPLRVEMRMWTGQRRHVMRVATVLIGLSLVRVTPVPAQTTASGEFFIISSTTPSSSRWW